MRVSALAVFTTAARLTFRRIGLLMVANVLWWLLSLPLITWPPATAGLYHLAHCLHGPDAETTTWRVFFHGFRAHLLRSWALMAVDLLLGGMLVINLLFYLARPAPVYWLWVPTAWFLAVWVGMQLYLWPLLSAGASAPLHITFRNALTLVLHYPGFTLGLLILLGVTSLVGMILAGPVLLILIAFLAMTQTVALHTLLGERA